jgi:hypothetical protein
MMQTFDFFITVYLDAGALSTDTATLAFAFSGTFSRYWDIKVTQIPCTSNYQLRLFILACLAQLNPAYYFNENSGK